MSVEFVLGRGLAIADIVAVARHGCEVRLSEGVLGRIDASRRTLERVAAGGQAVYGFNTGLGAKSGVTLESDAIAFQPQFLRGRDIGVGDRLPTDIVRSAMTVRLAGFCSGGSGISPHVPVALAAALNAGVHPIMRRWGSIGAADLGLMAALGRMLIGEGEAEYAGELRPAAEVLAAAGLAPVRLAPKDGLSLASANAVSIGHGALVVADATDLLDWQNSAVALTMEGIGANLNILDPRLQAARPGPGQREVAAVLRAMVQGSALYDPGTMVPLQDPLSIRCAPSINGVVWHALAGARAVIESELAASSDNPLVMVEDGAVLSTGNFHVPALALAFETLGLALAQAAIASAARFVLLTGAARSGLPRNLSPRGGAAAGFVSLQKTAGALLAGIRHAALPVILDVMSVSEGVEDHATQAPLTVQKCAEIVFLYRRLVALEMMAAAQAASLRGGRLGNGTAALQIEIRHLVDVLDEDRAIGEEVELLARHIAVPRKAVFCTAF